MLSTACEKTGSEVKAITASSAFAFLIAYKESAVCPKIELMLPNSSMDMIYMRMPVFMSMNSIS
jgi:hypothetical protein